jgi:nicotinate-nucleotide adenylyltransferase
VNAQRRVGVFGGSFDPIHIGHLIIAEILHYELRLDEVLFLPAGRPPHKPEQELAADHHRLAMLRLAISDFEGFSLSTVDLDRPGNSYTAETLQILKEQLGSSAELIFLMGQDSLRDLSKWREPDKIVERARLGVARRPHVQVSLDAIVREVPEAAGRIELVDVPLIGLSSSDIRKRIRAGDPFHFQVPHGVANYIALHGLYGYRWSTCND